MTALHLPQKHTHVCHRRGKKALRFYLTCYRLICCTTERHENTFKLYVCVCLSLCAVSVVTAAGYSKGRIYSSLKSFTWWCKWGQNRIRNIHFSLETSNHSLYPIKLQDLKLGKIVLSSLLFAFCSCLASDADTCIMLGKENNMQKWVFQYFKGNTICRSLHPKAAEHVIQLAAVLFRRFSEALQHSADKHCKWICCSYTAEILLIYMLLFFL